MDSYRQSLLAELKAKNPSRTDAWCISKLPITVRGDEKDERFQVPEIPTSAGNLAVSEWLISD